MNGNPHFSLSNQGNQRLVREVQLLQRCKDLYGLPVKGLIEQLIADADRRLPDVLPRMPEWKEFQWPESGEVDFRSYWRTKP